MPQQARLGWFLTHTALADYIAASARRALSGEVPAVLREYSFSFNEAAKRIRLKAEVERELSDDERDDILTHHNTGAYRRPLEPARLVGGDFARTGRRAPLSVLPGAPAQPVRVAR